jgi:RNA polymerase sigma-70 factor, ECF subfamily
MAPALVYPQAVVAELPEVTGDVAELAAEQASLRLEGVYREHFKGVWRVLRRVGVVEAQLDDAAQDVFLVVQRRLGELEHGAPLRSWVFGIAVRVASEYRRRAARWRTEPFSEGVSEASQSPARLTELQESVQLLHELLGELDESKRVVFVLSELEQLSAPEIAAVLGVSSNTVSSRLRSARARFAAALARRRAASHGMSRGGAR